MLNWIRSLPYEGQMPQLVLLYAILLVGLCFP